ncbi:MAG: hypothetical protein V7605_1439, partial [Acidimicrobiaceae bacterium]
MVGVGLVGGVVRTGAVGAGFTVLAGEVTTGREPAFTGPFEEPDLGTVATDVVGPTGGSAVAKSPGMVVEGSEAIGRLVSTWDGSDRLVPEARTTAKATTTRLATTMPGRRSFHRAVHQSCSEASQAAGLP